MAALLTAVSASYKDPEHGNEGFLTEVREPVTPHPTLRSAHTGAAKTPHEALEVLRNEPDYESLIETLKFLRSGSPDFSVTSPSPLAAQIVHVLVSETVPTYWNVFQASRSSKITRKKVGANDLSDLDLLLSCLRSVMGLNAILLTKKQFIRQSKENRKNKIIGGANIQEVLKTFLHALSSTLEGDVTIEAISNDIWMSPGGPAKQRAVWTEFLSIIGGKVLGISAEAEDIANSLSDKIGEKHWTANGGLYSTWLARNISHWSQTLNPDNETDWKICSDLLGKSFRLGQTETIIKEVLGTLLLQRQGYPKHLEKLLRGLPNSEQRTFILTSLKFISGAYFAPADTYEANSRWWRSDENLVSATAGMINLILDDEESRITQIKSWLTSSSGAGVGDGIGIRRAVVTALAVSRNDIEAVLEKILQQFGDQLYIRHTPTMQQEVHAQVLLLSAGTLHRLSPLRLVMIMRSGAHLSVVSNRLSASSPRARFLGMVVGEALSSLVEKGEMRLDFKMEEMQTPEARWFKSLVEVSDRVGPLDALKAGTVLVRRKGTELNTASPVSLVAKPRTLAVGSKITEIVEIDDDSNEEGSRFDGFTPYAKPDSDQEDSDEDATLITRNKPTTPVYVRDLITYLRDTDNYDRQKLGLRTAATLIRRKANFGTEVSSHAEELAALLVGLQDKFDLEGFQDMRMQGMIAILVAQPLKMGQWFSKTFFDGDYSILQRAAVLTTLGIGARELGGFAKEDAGFSTGEARLPTTFPSKILPEKMNRIYAPLPSEVSAVDQLSTQLTTAMVAPMAAELADKMTGPSALKVRTFSSRMEVEKKRKRPIANPLAKVVADGFFFPLTGRFFIHMRAYGSSQSNVIFQPYLLALFIKTLSLLIHASGPSTLSLPQMTSEFWDLLLGLRTQGIGDISIMDALLFAFLMILEINEDKRRLVEEHGRQILETQEWVQGVFGKLSSGGSEEDERVRMLAAGCLIRIREVVEKYQALLMGDLASFRT